MLFTDHELSELARLANYAYSHGNNGVGHRFSALSATGKNKPFPVAVYDEVMTIYRKWLVWSELP